MLVIMKNLGGSSTKSKDLLSQKSREYINIKLFYWERTYSGFVPLKLPDEPIHKWATAPIYRKLAHTFFHRECIYGYSLAKKRKQINLPRRTRVGARGKYSLILKQKSKIILMGFS